ncbi:MAG: hypothetical protein HC802_10190 [Caldilineaceae bacterium]|nr:hypothetical protein [Caldilineaceae bacterium]
MKFWQKRYWDHIIRNDADLETRLHYIHYNPVKHGYVLKPENWPYSSYEHWRDRGAYHDRWGWTLPDALKDCDVAGEPSERSHDPGWHRLSR